MNYSKIACFQQCPRRYQYAYVEMLSKIEEGKTEKDRNWGIGIHAGLAEYYTGKDVISIQEAFKREYPADLDPDDMAKTVRSGIETLQLYMDHYKGQDKNWKVLEVEVKDKFIFNEIEFTVVLDLIAENLQGGGIYFWDHKTSGRTPSFNYWKQFELSGQVSDYTNYVISKYGQCSGAIINNISVGHRKRAYKGEPSGFWAKFERQIFNRNKTQLETRKSDILLWKKLIEQAETNNSFPLHYSNGCTYCSFYELCLSCGDEQIKELMYTTLTTKTPQQEPEGVEL